MSCSLRRTRQAKLSAQPLIALREALYRIFTVRLANKPVSTADVTRLNRELNMALAHARLAPGAQSFQWDWDKLALDHMLWPLVRLAAELLTSARLARVRQCANATCGWLFLDSSRSGRRRWCTMRYCGNRAKARRHYARRRRGQAHKT